ncbi:MAG: hypothetical protein R3F42_04460 [Pseudomonadota bacterium]
MFKRLKSLFVQQVPAELSVCEFDCPVTECSVRNWAQCTLRHEGVLHGAVSVRHVVRGTRHAAAARAAQVPARSLFLTGYYR